MVRPLSNLSPFYAVLISHHFSKGPARILNYLRVDCKICGGITTDLVHFMGDHNINFRDGTEIGLHHKVNRYHSLTQIVRDRSLMIINYDLEGVGKLDA